jgi:ATP-dependent Clp protease ATP-binding subunit ClpC
MKAKVNEELKQHFRPEFLNRVDDTIVFPQLTQDQIVKIVDLMIARLDERLRDQEMTIELTDAAKELLAERGYDPVLGARPLRRAIQRDIEDVLSEKILFGEVKAGQIIKVDASGEGILGELTFSFKDHDGPILKATKADADRYAKSAGRQLPPAVPVGGAGGSGQMQPGS